MSEPTEIVCRHCGGAIISNDRDRTIAHTVPACPWFEKIMRHAGIPGQLVLLNDRGQREPRQ